MITGITISGYRAFSADHPVSLAIASGVTGFIGVNNSGKSSLLRFFFELRSLFQNLMSPIQISNALRSGLQAYSPPAGMTDINELFFNLSDEPIRIVFESDGDPFTIIVTIPRPTNTFKVEMAWDGDIVSPEAFQGGVENDRNVIWDGARADLSSVSELCRLLSDTLYIGPFRNALNIGTREDYYDISCGQSFIERWHNLKTGNSRSDADKMYGITRDIKTIFEFDDLEIDASNDNQSLQVRLNEKHYKLPELGSGLTQFILVLANAALRKPSIVLIDEPELNLHPSLQLDFLTSLAAHASHSLMFSTHSIGLARSAADRIYSVKSRRGEGSIVEPFESTAALGEFLGELSFSGYRELGFDLVLLVEGRHEVKTIQQFLRHYGKDHRVVLVPMGGGELINAKSAAELVELKRISLNLHALIDSERQSEGALMKKERRDFVRICEENEISCHVLGRRATEHYLTDAAIKAEKGPKYRALTPYEEMTSVSPVWGKEENWRIARRMSQADLQGTDLGGFLDSL